MKSNWKIKSIKECFKVRSGEFLPVREMKKDGEIDVYGGNGIVGKHDNYNLSGENIVIGRVGAKCGNVRLVRDKMWLTDNALYISEFYEKFDLRFLEYLLKIKDLRNTANQAAQPVISYTTIKDIILVIPPFQEQQRIVTILDMAFEAIARAKENAEKNLQNAKEIFESYLQSVFANTGDGWENKKLGEISKINYGYTEKASFEEIGPKFLRITDIQDNNVDWNTVPFCILEKTELSKYQLSEGDIVFARTGATTGKSFLVKNPPVSVFASYLIRLKIIEYKKLLPNFLYLYFQTKTYWDNIKIGLSGSAQGGFNASKLADMPIPIPSIHEQKCIVSKLDVLSIETKKLEAIYNQKLTDLEELKKSILQKAFNGEL